MLARGFTKRRLLWLKSKLEDRGTLRPDEYEDLLILVNDAEMILQTKLAAKKEEDDA